VRRLRGKDSLHLDPVHVRVKHMSTHTPNCKALVPLEES
jgi:hypothetical protein